MEEERNKSVELCLGTAYECLGDSVLVRSFSPPSPWMQGFEIPATAKTQGVLCVLETMKYLKIVTKALEKAPEKVAALIAQLQCVYSSAYSMGNKQGELEADVQQESYDIVADEIF